MATKEKAAEATQQQKKINAIKKISVATVFGKVNARMVPEKPGELFVMRVMGRAFTVKSGTKIMPDGKTHEWKGLEGDFLAINPKTQDQFRSPVCFVPDVALAYVEPQLRNGAALSCDFAFDIVAVADDTVASGYVYNCRPLMDNENDPVAGMLAKINVPLLT